MADGFPLFLEMHTALQLSWIPEQPASQHRKHRLQHPSGFLVIKIPCWRHSAWQGGVAGVDQWQTVSCRPASAAILVRIGGRGVTRQSGSMQLEARAALLAPINARKLLEALVRVDLELLREVSDTWSWGRGQLKQDASLPSQKLLKNTFQDSLSFKINHHSSPCPFLRCRYLAARMACSKCP